MKKTEASKPAKREGQESVLPPKVAALYSKRKGLADVFVCAEFGTVDLSIINVVMAQRLAEKGYLIKQSGSNSV